ncbi:D-cysteine desulfhydrase family protein [candidate division KSB1 bacterium]|nr:D-cysteine desulfhydrase family protein [candidate division KSB1 bacterium]
MGFKFPGRITLANLPTRIEKLGRLSAEIGGPEIWIKRDDQTGGDLTGNKVRKLEFLLADALQKGADMVITCGGIQSNHARATAIAAVRQGMKPFLVLRGQETKEYDGNLFLDYLVGSEFKFITEEEYEVVEDIMAEVAERLKTKGRKPYVIPEGGSNALGAMGYVKAALEIKDQAGPDAFDLILSATGSGGTHAGLLMGKKIFGLKSEITSVNVCDDEEKFKNRIKGIIDEAKRNYKLSLGLSKEDVKIIDGYVGPGYSQTWPEEREFIKRVARKEGVILDPVYTGKALLGLIDQIKKGRFKKCDKILFIHTGGIFGLFPQKELFWEWGKV